jgi:excisionase family DNA binding protein
VVNSLEQILEAFEARVRQVVREELAAHGSAVTEMVTLREYARDHSIAVSTVRQMIKDGRIEAIRIGKRQWRVRRDAPIGQPLPRTRAPRTGTPADRARRILEGSR